MYKSMCVRIITAPPCFMFVCRSGYSICQENLNDLVGSEMCHKGALMDEGEHGANDTATSTCSHSHLMKAPTPETVTFNGVCHWKGNTFLTHINIRNLQMTFWKWCWWSHLVRRTSRCREIYESGREKFRKMSAFGDLIERMSNGLQYSGHLIHASSSIWVSLVIIKSLCRRVGLTKLMSVRLHKCAHGSEAHRRKNTQTVSNYSSCSWVRQVLLSELPVCDVNLREIKTGDVLISGTQERWKFPCCYTHAAHTHQGKQRHTYLRAENILFIDYGIIQY